MWYSLQYGTETKPNDFAALFLWNVTIANALDCMSVIWGLMYKKQ